MKKIKELLTGKKKKKNEEEKLGNDQIKMTSILQLPPKETCVGQHLAII